jgi:hypothetical protein
MSAITIAYGFDHGLPVATATDKNGTITKVKELKLSFGPYGRLEGGSFNCLQPTAHELDKESLSTSGASTVRV